MAIKKVRLKAGQQHAELHAHTIDIILDPGQVVELSENDFNFLMLQAPQLVDIVEGEE